MSASPHELEQLITGLGGRSKVLVGKVDQVVASRHEVQFMAMLSAEELPWQLMVASLALAGKLEPASQLRPGALIGSGNAIGHSKDLLEGCESSGWALYR